MNIKPIGQRNFFLIGIPGQNASEKVSFLIEKKKFQQQERIFAPETMN